MGASNFSAGNRIIFISNEDREAGFMPKYDRETNLIDANFNLFDVYVEAGYYEGCKIDFKDRYGSEVFNDDDSVLYNRFFEECNNVGQAVYKLNRDFANLFMFYDEDEVKGYLKEVEDAYRLSIDVDTEYELSDTQKRDLGYEWEKRVQKLYEKAYDKERVEVNKYLDKIRDEYGFSELVRINPYMSSVLHRGKRHADVETIYDVLSGEDITDVRNFIMANYADIASSDFNMNEDAIKEAYNEWSESL